MRSFTIETLREIIAQRDEALLERFEVELNRCDQVELNFRSSLGFIEEGFNKQQYQAFIEALKRNKTISSVNLSYLSVEEFKNEFREGIAELLTDNKVIKKLEIFECCTISNKFYRQIILALANNTSLLLLHMDKFKLRKVKHDEYGNEIYNSDATLLQEKVSIVSEFSKNNTLLSINIPNPVDEDFEYRITRIVKNNKDNFYNDCEDILETLETGEFEDIEEVKKFWPKTREIVNKAEFLLHHSGEYLHSDDVQDLFKEIVLIPEEYSDFLKRYISNNFFELMGIFRQNNVAEESELNRSFLESLTTHISSVGTRVAISLGLSKGDLPINKLPREIQENIAGYLSPRDIIKDQKIEDQKSYYNSLNLVLVGAAVALSVTVIYRTNLVSRMSDYIPSSVVNTPQAVINAGMNVLQYACSASSNVSLGI